MGGHGHFDKRMFAAGQRRFDIAFKGRGKRLLGLQFRMLRRQLPDPVEDEKGLEIHRLFAPETAVVVEHGDAPGHRDEVR